MAKKATAGEKIVMGIYGGPLHGIREYQSIDYANRRKLARRIDTAIKRAVKQAWACGRAYECKLLIGTSQSVLCAKEIAARISTKHGVKL